MDAAAAIGLEALSITDHDTFDGFDEAAPLAAERGLRLLCGIEVSTRLPRPGGGRARSVHLLGYFPAGPGDSFRAWIRVQQQIRYERNLALVDRLQELGIDIQYGEVRAIGRNMVARPHFARVMVRKGYVKDLQSAFDEYLDESAIAYVEKHDPGLEEAITEIRRGGGIPSVAHAVRIGLGDAAEVELLQRLIPAGLLAIETWHSDHSVERRRKYQDLAVSRAARNRWIRFPRSQQGGCRTGNRTRGKLPCSGGNPGTPAISPGSVIGCGQSSADSMEGLDGSFVRGCPSRLPAVAGTTRHARRNFGGRHRSSRSGHSRS